MTAVVGESQKINVSTFVEVVKRSKLVDPKRLEHALKSVALTSGRDVTADQIAENLIVAGLITKWQAAQLLKGKYRGFSLGKYTMRRPLGRGGMGVVYEAEHSVLNTRVAIKILPTARNDVERSVSRFLAEARAAAKLSHPNIVHVHDCDVIDNRRFMVMDLVNGSNLGEIVERHGPMSYKNAILMLKQAAAGLGHAHDHGVTHRDVKPHNFLVTKEGQLKVADMGLALFEIDSPDRHTQDGSKSIVGTVDFLAPEQAWDSRKVDRRADMYSLGCTLYFMITGKAPFQSGTLAQRLAKHQTAAPVPLTQIRPDCPQPIWNLCQKMMAKRPEDRLQRMSEVVRVCDQLLPMLNGGRDIASLANISGSGDSNSGFLSDGWNSGELLSMDGVDSMSRSIDASGSILSQAAFTDIAAELPGASPTTSGSDQTFWAGSAGSSPAPKKRKKAAAKPVKFSESLYAKVAVASGLVLALTGLSLSIYKVITMDDSQQGYKPSIKQVEARDGSQVIIVHDSDK